MTRQLRARILVVVAALAVLFVVVLLPPVQTALVRGLIGGTDGVDIEIGRVWAGPWGASVESLRVAAPGIDIEVPRAELDLGFWSSVGRLSLVAESATASGIRIRVGNLPERTDVESDPVGFSGFASLARLPKRLIVNRAELDGTIELAVTDEITAGGPWSMSALDLGPDRRGEASVEATIEAHRNAEPFAAAVVSAAVSAAVGRNGRVTDVRGDAGLHAAAGKPRGIDARFTAELSETVESCTLIVEASGGHRLLDASAELDVGQRVVDARWSAAIAPEIVSGFSRGRPLPELALTSSGVASLDLEGDGLSIDGGGRLQGRGWAELDPRLREIDELVVDAEVNATKNGDILDLEEVRISLAGRDGRQILRVTGIQPVAIDLADWSVTPKSWGEPALRFEADRTPLRWTNGFDGGVLIEDGRIDAGLDIVPMSPHHTVIATHRPIRFMDLRIGAGNGQAQTRSLNLTIEPRISLDDGVLDAAIERARLVAEESFDLRFGGRAVTSPETWPVIGFDGELSVVVPGLRSVIKDIDRIAGRARLELDLGRLELGADSGSLDIIDASGRSMVAVRFDNDEPLQFRLPGMTPDWETSTPQRLDVVVDAFPIAWLSPFIPELDIVGGAVHGELHAVTGGGLGLTLEPSAPFEIRDLQPAYRGWAFAAGSTASVEPRLRLDNRTLRFALENIRVRTPTAGRLDGGFTLEAERADPGKIATSIFVEGEFPAVAQRIGRLGALSWRQEAVIHAASRTLEVTDLEVGLTDAAGTRFLELRTLRSFDMIAEPFRVGVDGGSPDILVATITPLELEQLFPKLFGCNLEGVLPQGEFVGRVENGGLLLAAEQPLIFRNVTVSWEDAALLDRVTIGLEHEILYSVDGLQARSIEFTTLGPRGTRIGDATLRAVMPLTDRQTISSLHFEALANLEPLTRQPIFNGLPVFLEGTVGGAIDLDDGESTTFSGSFELRGARVGDGGVLPDLDAGIELLSTAGERLEAAAPIRISSAANGVSDLRFDGEIEKTETGARFDAALGGERIAVADVMAFVNLVVPEYEEAPSADPPELPRAEAGERWSTTAIAQLRERRDTRPVWGERVSGRARLDIGRVQLPRYAVRNIRGILEVDPARFALTTARAELLGAELAMTGGLDFDAAAERPYELGFETSFTDLDLGALFRAVDPDVPPTLEGVFEVRSDVSGRGRNLADLGIGSLGSVRLTGRDGVFRGLAGQFGLARTGAGVLGFLTFSKQLKAVSRLLGELEALEFDTFAVELARETPSRFAISELEVVSPLVVIDGSGGVEVEPGQPLATSALDASFDMAARGDLTILFDGLGLLGDGEDDEGYRPLTRPVTVGGTVAEPDTSAFYEMLDEASRDSKGVVGVAMRRVNKKLQKSR
ncbi:MAG: hypothetical protein V2I67_18475 [Thermoanaerobaculales bacterium]|jgi:hypothetical protein|nr:hypothetical protein [Thermoanaerobaculales bacterium]